jgi:hypothetical protein
MNRFSAGLKSNSPAEAGGSHQIRVDDIGGLFSGSHADSLAPASVRSGRNSKEKTAGLKHGVLAPLRHD